MKVEAYGKLYVSFRGERFMLHYFAIWFSRSENKKFNSGWFLEQWDKRSDRLMVQKYLKTPENKEL